MKEKKQCGCAVFFIVWVIAGGVIGIIFNSINKTGQDMGSIVFLSILIGMLIALVFFSFRMAVLTIKLKAAAKKRKKELEASGVVNMLFASHVAGLPLAEGMNCNILEYEDKIIFEANGSDFTLMKEKTTDISIKTDAEITSQYVSSVGGVVAGAVLFGPLGAIVGGRAKKKKSSKISNYLIFTYVKDGTIDYISFDVTGTWHQATKICDNFKNGLSAPNVSVQL